MLPLDNFEQRLLAIRDDLGFVGQFDLQEPTEIELDSLRVSVGLEAA